MHEWRRYIKGVSEVSRVIKDDTLTIYCANPRADYYNGKFILLNIARIEHATRHIGHDLTGCGISRCKLPASTQVIYERYSDLSLCRRHMEELSEIKVTKIGMMKISCNDMFLCDNSKIHRRTVLTYEDWPDLSQYIVSPECMYCGNYGDNNCICRHCFSAMAKIYSVHMTPIVLLVGELLNSRQLGDLFMLCVNMLALV